MRAYTLAERIIDLSKDDARQLDRCRVTRPIAAQLYRAVGSIAANIAEGYSRGSGKDRARIFEFALGSVRESSVWYEMARPILGSAVEDRLATLTEIRRLLLVTIPRERGWSIARKETKGGLPPERGSKSESAFTRS